MMPARNAILRACTSQGEADVNGVANGPQAALYKEALGRAFQQDNRMRPRHLGYCGDDSDGRKIMQPVWYGTYNGALP